MLHWISPFKWLMVSSMSISFICSTFSQIQCWVGKEKPTMEKENDAKMSLNEEMKPSDQQMNNRYQKMLLN